MNFGYGAFFKAKIFALANVVFFILAFVPLYIFFGWIGGHIVNFFCGEFVVNGLNYMFATERFTREMLPVVCAILSFIGGYFRSAK